MGAPATGRLAGGERTNALLAGPQPVTGFATRAWSALRWRVGVASAGGELERVRERIERRDARRALERARGGRDVCWVERDDEDEPLVTIRIATYRRAALLRDRALASALRQSYERIEVVVVGDGTDDETGRVIEDLRDARIRYVNLGHRTVYPEDPHRRYSVAGSPPMTVGTLLAAGAWIAPCDDDDEMTDDHVEVLLRHAKTNRLELVHSRTAREVAPGAWVELGAPALTIGQVTHGSVMYSAGLRFLPYSTTCWKLPEPQDWNLWRRMRDIGVVMGHLDRVTYRYHLPDDSTRH